MESYVFTETCLNILCLILLQSFSFLSLKEKNKLRNKNKNINNNSIDKMGIAINWTESGTSMTYLVFTCSAS